MQIANQIVTGIKNAYRYARDIWAPQYRYDTLPPERIRAALMQPFVRQAIIKFSRQEYERNPYYANVINNLEAHTIGPTPTIIGMSDKDEFNNLVEDLYLQWSSDNGIGKVYREIRKEAALTGLAIAIPYKKETINPVGLSYKVFGMDALETPRGYEREEKMVDGILFNDDWDPIRFYFKNEDPTKEPKEYTTSEVLYWTKSFRNGCVHPLPECYAAFTVYPYVRRYLEAVIEGEEFRASIPMAIEVDPKAYPVLSGTSAPVGRLEYEPKTIPTLPTGTKLAGLPLGNTSSDKANLIQLFAATCALTVQMPKNLALGDSSNSNMASAQVDTQPWKNKVNIDRFDLEPVFRKSYYEWWRIMVRREQVPARLRNKYLTFFPHTYVYDDLFSHPDPLKNANARAVDLISGSTTLQRIYSSLGKNPRRELESEARLLGITYQELTQMILSSRTTDALQILGLIAQNASEDQPASQN